MTFRWYSAIALLAAAVALATYTACPAPAGEEVSVVLGRVSDRAGAPLSAVTVSGAGNTTTTGAGGLFELLIPSEGTSVLIFERSSMAPAYRSVTPGGAPISSVFVTLVAPEVSTNIDLSSGPQTVSFGGGATLVFPQGSVVTSTGEQPGGTVGVTVTWVSGTDATEIAPVPLVGTDGTETWPLVSYGMLDVSLDCGAETCGLAAGEALTLTIPAAVDDPSEALMFSVDPDQGIWVQEGTATNSGGIWRGDITHLSWWNVDGFLKVPVDERACVRFVARGPDSSPVSGVRIESRWGPYDRYSIGGTTNADGTLCEERFPSGELITVQYSTFLASGAVRPTEWRSVTFTPTAVGARCASPDCQEVPLTVTCATDNECGPGSSCSGGVCVVGGGTDPDPDTGATDADAGTDTDAGTDAVGDADTGPQDTSIDPAQATCGDGICNTAAGERNPSSSSYCPGDCPSDCGCDFMDGICEAAEPGSRLSCDCDPDCGGVNEACMADGYCDEWCQVSEDSDCDN